MGVYNLPKAVARQRIGRESNSRRGLADPTAMFIGTARIVCGALSVYLSGVCLSVCPTRCGGFAAVCLAVSGYRSTAAAAGHGRRCSAAHSSAA